MTPDYRALCAELIDALDSGISAGRIRMSPLADRARALLTEADGREPASVALQPSDGELWTMYDEMRGEPGDWAWVRDYARAALARWGRPVAAPVAMIELITDMAMHLAHMQELLEDYEYGDPEDYHWYRESVRLRAVAAEALA